MARTFTPFSYVICCYIFSLLINDYEANLKIDHIKTSTRKPQPIFGYIKHVVSLRFHDIEYSKSNRSIYIPGAGVIIAPRIVLTAAHLGKRGRVTKIDVHHENCGHKALATISYMETHTLYNGKPPHYDIALLLMNRPDKKGLPEICDKLKIVSLPKKSLANKFGGRAILVAHEYYYEHFYFTTRLIRTTSTTKTSKDDMYYSSEYYSDAEDTCCSTPKSQRLLRRRPVENVIRIENCPRDINGHFFCNHEQNRPIPNEGDIGTGVINRFGRLIGILSFQRFVTYGSNINFYIDVHASVNWIKSTMNLMFEKEKNVTSKAPFTLKIF